MYSTAFAAHLVGLRPQRVRRWLRGYSYSYAVEGGASERSAQQPPVLQKRAEEDSPFASFLDLMDLLVVKECLERGFSLQKVRKAIDEVYEITKVGHFAQREIFTAGSALFLRLQRPSGAFVELLAGRQRGISDVIEQVGSRIEFSEQSRFAERWFPLGPSLPIVVDPKIAFGAPSLAGHGIKTSVVYDLFVAEDEKVEAVCSWLNLTKAQVKAAVRFERRIAAAA